MDRMDDIGKKIDAHLKSAWGRTFLCTAQEVRESATVALMGIRAHLRQQESLRHVDLLYLRKRCDDVREQLRLLIARGDKRHARPLRRIMRSYAKRLDAMLAASVSSRGCASQPASIRSGEGVDVGDDAAGDGGDHVA